jgi:hypothetical protein
MVNFELIQHNKKHSSRRRAAVLLIFAKDKNHSWTLSEQFTPDSLPKNTIQQIKYASQAVLKLLIKP